MFLISYLILWGGGNEALTRFFDVAWKIAHVLWGWASEKLLDTYEEERRAYALDLIAFDKKLGKMMNEGDASKYDEWVFHL